MDDIARTKSFERRLRKRRSQARMRLQLLQDRAVLDSHHASAAPSMHFASNSVGAALVVAVQGLTATMNAFILSQSRASLDGRNDMKEDVGSGSHGDGNAAVEADPNLASGVGNDGKSDGDHGTLVALPRVVSTLDAHALNIVGFDVCDNVGRAIGGESGTLDALPRVVDALDAHPQTEIVREENDGHVDIESDGLSKALSASSRTLGVGDTVFDVAQIGDQAALVPFASDLVLIAAAREAGVSNTRFFERVALLMAGTDSESARDTCRLMISEDIYDANVEIYRNHNCGELANMPRR